jgi:hypothetical protein
MATYVNNLRLKEITTGDEDGTWGTSTNTNLELITDGFSYGTKEMAADANETFTMPDATADDTRSFYLKITSAVSLTATREVNLTLGGTLANVDLTSQVTGTLPIANGGTGSTSTTYVDLTTNVTGTLAVANGGTGVTTSTGSGSVVLSTAPTLEGIVTLNQTNAATNTSAEINNTIGDKGTFLNFTQSRSGGKS